MVVNLGVCRVLIFICCLLNGNALLHAQVLGNNEQFDLLISQVDEIRNQQPQEALSLLEKAQSSGTAYNLLEQIKVYALQAELLSEIGQHNQSKQAAIDGLELAKKLTSPTILIAELSYSLGYAYENLGEINLALTTYLAGLEVAESLEDKTQVAKGLINIGAIYYQTEQYESALVVLNDALAIANNLSDIELKGYVNSELGILYGNLEQFEQALKYYQASYDYYQQIGKTMYAVNNLRNMGINYASIENYEQAIATYKKILELQGSFNNTEILLSAHTGLAWAYVRKKEEDHEQAQYHLQQAEVLVNQIEQHYLPLQYLVEKAFILDTMSKFDQALETIAQAQALYQQAKFKLTPVNELSLIRLKAAIYHDLGKFELAYQELEKFYRLNKAYQESRQLEAVSDLRMQYESEQADVQQQILKKQAQIENLALEQSHRLTRDKERYFLFLALVTLLFAWLLNKLFRGHRSLLEMARTDVLTGLINRRRLTELAHKQISKCHKNKQPFSLLIIDCDHFKQINDTFGHSAGDAVLVALAKLGLDCVDRTMSFGRLGGEEFMMLLPGTDNLQAVAVAERFRAKVAKRSWPVINHQKISVSIGVATAEIAQELSFSQLMKMADTHLFSAKANGRNQVCS